MPTRPPVQPPRLEEAALRLADLLGSLHPQAERLTRSAQLAERGPDPDRGPARARLAEAASGLRAGIEGALKLVKAIEEGAQVGQ